VARKGTWCRERMMGVGKGLEAAANDRGSGKVSDLNQRDGADSERGEVGWWRTRRLFHGRHDRRAQCVQFAGGVDAGISQPAATMNGMPAAAWQRATAALIASGEPCITQETGSTLPARTIRGPSTRRA